MKLKKLGAALVVVVALGAVLASSAFAAATTTDVKWYTGSAPGTELTGSETLNGKLVGTATFATTVSGTAVVLHSTGMECVGCKIENSGGVAVGSGQVKFTGVTVEKPAKCSTTSSITSKALSMQPDWMIGTANYIKFVPTAGEETGFATLELTGAECPLKTTIIPKGSIFLQSVNATGTQAATQRVNSSEAINKEAGGSLHVGTELASLSMTTDWTISISISFGTH